MFDEVLGSDSEQECATAPEASTSAAQFEPEEEEAAAAEMVQGEQAKHEKVLDLAKLAKFNKKVDNTGFVLDFAHVGNEQFSGFMSEQNRPQGRLHFPHSSRHGSFEAQAPVKQVWRDESSVSGPRP